MGKVESLGASKSSSGKERVKLVLPQSWEDGPSHGGGGQARTQLMGYIDLR